MTFYKSPINREISFYSRKKNKNGQLDKEYNKDGEGPQVIRKQRGEEIIGDKRQSKRTGAIIKREDKAGNADRPCPCVSRKQAVMREESCGKEFVSIS